MKKKKKNVNNNNNDNNITNNSSYNQKGSENQDVESISLEIGQTNENLI